MHFSFSRVRVVRWRWLLPALTMVASSVSGCATHYQLEPRRTAEVGGPSWFGPSQAREQERLLRWERAVGPPFVMHHEPSADLPRATSDLLLVSWNVAVGEGDVLALLTDLRARDRRRPLVLLLQEAYREGDDVPQTLAAESVVAGRLGLDGGKRRREDIESIAAASGLNAYYVPSMRNGSPSDSREDRGNAILTNLPLDDLGALELPFERQRRVAVAATVSGTSEDGTPWRIRLLSAHLDNLVGARRLWIAGGGFARARQARALVDFVRHDEVAILGGDFNTWFGFAEPAFQETARAFPDTEVSDFRATFRGLLRLDHLFFRLPDGWRAEFSRGESRYGSDHFPLVAQVHIGHLL